MRASTCSSRTWRPRAACSSTSDANADVYLPRVDWFPDSRGIAVQRQSRDQKTLELLRFDALSGRGRVLLTERNDHWVPLHRELTFLQQYAAIHLGVVARRFPASLPVRQRRQADPPAHLGRVHGGGRIAGTGDSRRRRARASACTSSPTCPRRSSGSCIWVSLDSPGAPQRVTTGAGWHSVAMSQDARVFVDAFSSADTPRNVTSAHCGRQAAVHDAAQPARCHASVCAVPRRTRARGVRHDRRRRRAGDALQIAEAAQSRRRANVIRCSSTCTAGPACSA